MNFTARNYNDYLCKKQIYNSTNLYGSIIDLIFSYFEIENHILVLSNDIPDNLNINLVIKYYDDNDGLYDEQYNYGYTMELIIYFKYRDFTGYYNFIYYQLPSTPIILNNNTGCYNFLRSHLVMQDDIYNRLTHIWNQLAKISIQELTQVQNTNLLANAKLDNNICISKDLLTNIIEHNTKYKIRTLEECTTHNEQEYLKVTPSLSALYVNGEYIPQPWQDGCDLTQTYLSFSSLYKYTISFVVGFIGAAVHILQNGVNQIMPLICIKKIYLTSKCSTRGKSMCQKMSDYEETYKN